MWQRKPKIMIKGIADKDRSTVLQIDPDRPKQTDSHTVT